MIEHALSLLKQGELVVIPTETVYGLAGNAADPAAVRKIFALKGRPADHPLIVHIAGQAQLTDWADDIPAAAYQLANAFWPGPLTFILKKQPWVSALVTGGQDSIGLRAPNHPLSQQLLQQFGGGLAAPSANHFGQVSPTTAQHVEQDFGHQCPFILDGGACFIGLESTIISLIDNHPVLLRPGSISQAQIETVLQQTIRYQEHPIPLRVSGLLDSHYAPHTPLVMGTLTQILAAIDQQPDQHSVLIHHSPLPTLSNASLHTLRMPSNNANAYAQMLYAILHSADSYGANRILLEKPGSGLAWLAINDRLQRAASIEL